MEGVVRLLMGSVHAQLAAGGEERMPLIGEPPHEVHTEIDSDGLHFFIPKALGLLVHQT